MSVRIRIDYAAMARNASGSVFSRRRLAARSVAAMILLIAVSGCMTVAKRFPQETASAQFADVTATVVGYMRNFLVHSTYGEISRVDGESLGGSTYAATLAPGRRLIVVRMTQVSAMNPLLFGEASCAFELDAIAGATYQLTPPDMKTYWRFWSRPPGVTPRRFETTLLLDVSSEGADKRPLEVAADCGNPAACRASADCDFLRENNERDDPDEVVCERPPAARFGRCVVAHGDPADGTAPLQQDSEEPGIAKSQ